MPDTQLCLEALSCISGLNIEQTGGRSQLSPQDFVNIVGLRAYYRKEGFKQLEYESLDMGSLSILSDEDQDLYSSPAALEAAPERDSLRSTVKINPADFFHPQYDYDFTHVKDGDKVFERGDEPYLRPSGWQRAALRVLGVFSGGDGWLGTGSTAWPVCYHGNLMDGSLGVILSPRQQPDDEPSFLDAAAASMVTEHTRGRGVYCTPEVKTAEKYCKKFKSKADGKTYKVLLQNRINQEKRQKCVRENVWLVYVPEGSTDAQTRVIIQEAVRPYGLLIKQE